MNIKVITVDGPSGTGKGTISLMLAEYLKWHYLDSGAIYRLLAVALHKNKIDLCLSEQMIQLAKSMNIRFDLDQHGSSQAILDDEDVTGEIRTEYCGQDASKIAAIPEVRGVLLAKQRDFAKPPGLVTDGRDMGTVVFPNAQLKIYLYASADERAERRYLQLKEIDKNMSFADVKDELIKRDTRDLERINSPLKPATDAIMIDTSGLTIVQVFDLVLRYTRERGLR